MGDDSAFDDRPISLFGKCDLVLAIDIEYPAAVYNNKYNRRFASGVYILISGLEGGRCLATITY